MGLAPRHLTIKKDATALRLEAWWTVNPHPPAQASADVSKKHGAMDSLPDSPLCQAVNVLVGTDAYVVSLDACRDQAPTQGEVAAPSPTSNVQWSIRSCSSPVVASPIDLSRNFLVGEQQTYIDWVYRFSIYYQGSLIDERCRAWFRNKNRVYTPVAGEYSMPPMTGGPENV